MDNNKILKYLRDNNFFPSKKLGQNFLMNNDFKKKIVNSIDINRNDFVLEIGPGFGALTSYIIEKTNNLTLIEFDKRLAEILKNNFKNIEIINKDVLRVDLRSIFESKNNIEKSIVISNLPYSISSQILINLLKIQKIDYMVLMVQKEMSDRITSKIGSKKYNGFSIIISLIAHVEKLFDIPATAFHPMPNVTSTVLKITPIKNIDFNILTVEKFLRISFLNKRKKLINNLKTKFNEKMIIDSFLKLNININSRPENLKPFQFIELMKELKYEN